MSECARLLGPGSGIWIQLSASHTRGPAEIGENRKTGSISGSMVLFHVYAAFLQRPGFVRACLGYWKYGIYDIYYIASYYLILSYSC